MKLFLFFSGRFPFLYFKSKYTIVQKEKKKYTQGGLHGCTAALCFFVKNKNPHTQDYKIVALIQHK